jgi:GH24 family phage-related lysozyme (muramidase)
MRASEKGLALIRQFEGLRLSAYKCSANVASIGYGTSVGGVAALLTMLSSCASGLAVVNIDNGYGAAVAVQRILRQRTPLSK